MRLRLYIVLLLLPAYLGAGNMYEVGIRAGMANWNAQTEYVQAQPGIHAGIEAAYTWLAPHFAGIRIGLTVDRHACAFGKTGYTDSYQTIDVENQTMQVDYTIGRLHEEYSVWSAGIPVQIVFNWDNLRLCAGPKAVFPLSPCRWYEKAEGAQLSVYYPDYDNRVYEAYPLAASRHFEEYREGTKQLPVVQWWLAAEMTYTIPLVTSAKHYGGLSIGVYFDYCFSNLAHSHSDAVSLLMLSDTRDGFPLHRIMTPVIESNRQGEPLVNNCSMYDAGIKIAWTITPFNPHNNSRYGCKCL